MDQLGDGHRSLFYLSLVSSLLEAEEVIDEEKATVLTILAVEEPENHISPQLLGRVMKNLMEISLRKNAQVVLTSHSPSIIKRVDPENICHLRIDPNIASTLANKILLPDKSDEAYTYIKEAVRSYPELYFSSLVVLGEGDSEEIVLPRFLEAQGIQIDDNGISIVPLGGRHVNHMWRLLNQLRIPHITLLDLDLGRKSGGWERIRYVVDQLIQFGHDKQELLKICVKTDIGPQTEILTEDQFANFHKTYLTSEFTKEWINFWLTKLESAPYNVFFSAPLDLDFLLLESFPDVYKKTVPKGPKIPNRETEEDEYQKKLNKGMIATLKNEHPTAATFTDDQLELMIWYNTLFLGRSKPSTHLAALVKLNQIDLPESIPPIFIRIVSRVKELLGKAELGDVY